MRNEGIVKFLSIVSFIFVVLILCNILFLRVVRKQYLPDVAIKTTSSIFNVSGQINEWARYFGKWKELARENMSLRDITSQYISTEATIESLKSENDMLRKSAGLATHLRRQVISGGIFNVSFEPSGYFALINKGSSDGVIVGQAVISPDGVLVGKIVSVSESSSKIIILNNPEFSVTVKVLDGDTSGILRGALNNGMVLDLVTQGDKIKEGDILITTGDDLLPPGLVVGVVRHVEDNDTQLFKKIGVDPKVSVKQGAVMIIK
ncbi:MAG: rod shape-determining protein MreC [Patescibacteria group bacterium]